MKPNYLDQIKKPVTAAASHSKHPFLRFHSHSYSSSPTLAVSAALAANSATPDSDSDFLNTKGERRNVPRREEVLVENTSDLHNQVEGPLILVRRHRDWLDKTSPYFAFYRIQRDCLSWSIRWKWLRWLDDRTDRDGLEEVEVRERVGDSNFEKVVVEVAVGS